MKKESILKLGLILLVIAGIAGALLGTARALTADSIARQEKLANETAIKELIPNADEFKDIDDIADEKILAATEALKGGDTVGYALRVSTKGYGGDIVFMVGIAVDGKILGVRILSHSETPGLGANCSSDDFYSQYAGKDGNTALGVAKAGPGANDIQAITGATITTRAVTEAVNHASEYCRNNLKGGEGNG